MAGCKSSIFMIVYTSWSHSYSDTGSIMETILDLTGIIIIWSLEFFPQNYSQMTTKTHFRTCLYIFLWVIWSWISQDILNRCEIFFLFCSDTLAFIDKFFLLWWLLSIIFISSVLFFLIYFLPYDKLCTLVARSNFILDAGTFRDKFISS